MTQKEKKFFVAFSIHGTNCFIVAEKTTTGYQDIGNGEYLIDGQKFKVAQSRRPNYTAEKDGIKLYSNDLANVDGSQTKSPTKVMRFFNALEDTGWKIVNREGFVATHWKGKTKK